MNRISVFLSVLSVFLLFGLSASAQSNSHQVDIGKELYSNCQAALRTMEVTVPTATDSLMAAKCQGYLEAFTDLRGFEITDFCPPDEATLGTSLRIYLNFMAKNPVYMDRPRREGLRAALKETYPCPTASR